MKLMVGIALEKMVLGKLAGSAGLQMLRWQEVGAGSGMVWWQVQR